MSSIDEKRVYGDRTGATEVYVASGVGIVRVSVATDTVGEFGLLERCVARDVASGPGTIAVATDEDVLVRSLEDHEDRVRASSEFADTGFGPAVVVGFDGDDLVAAGPDGTVARHEDDEWQPIESPSMALEVQAIDGSLVGTTDGIYRIQTEKGTLEYIGLSDVRDVSAAGIPLAATAEGLYALGNGWLRSHEGAFDVVSSDPRSEGGSLERANAVSGREVYDHRDGEWVADSTTSEPVVDFAYGETTYAVTASGTFLAATDDGWRSRTLGVGDVSALTIAPHTD